MRYHCERTNIWGNVIANRSGLCAAILAILLCMTISLTSKAQLNTPRKISAIEGDARGRADNGLNFRTGNLNHLVNGGDIDGNGVHDLVFAVDLALWILFMNAEGTVRSYQKVTLRLPDGTPEELKGIAPLGDVDNNGVPDLIGGVEPRPQTGRNPHATVMYLNKDGTLKDSKKVCEHEPRPDGIDWSHCFITEGDRALDIDGDGNPDYTSWMNGVTVTFLDANEDLARVQHICNFEDPDTNASCHSGNFTGEASRKGFGGGGISGLGDLDGDGVSELAAGAPRNEDGCETPDCSNGVVWILFMNRNGTVKDHQKIGRTDGGFAGVLRDSSHFGWDVAALEDLDGDRIPELAVGAPGDPLQGTRGEVWILFMNRDGTVSRQQKITQDEGGFTSRLHENARFGRLVTSLGAIDQESVETLVTVTDLDPADIDDPHRGSQGALWFLSLKSDGTVHRSHKIRSTDFLFLPEDYDHLGSALAYIGDLDGDGIVDLAAGAPDSDDLAAGAPDSDDGRGTVWILFLNANGTLKRHQHITVASSGFDGTLEEGDRFGAALANLGAGEDGGVTLAVGAPGDDDRGAVWLLHLSEDGTVLSHQRITLDGDVGDGDQFGAALAPLGDLDGDGMPDVAVGAPFDDEAGVGLGVVWVLNLDENGSVASQRKIPPIAGSAQFGRALADLGERSRGRGLAVGGEGDSGLWVLQLDPDGTTASAVALSPSDMNVDAFDGSLAGFGDIDGDGISELAVGTSTRGIEGMTLLFLSADDSVTYARTLASIDTTRTTGFGKGLAPLGDLDNNGVPDVAIGAPFSREGGEESGAVWLISLRELLGVSIEVLDVDPAVPMPGQDIVVSARVNDHGGQGIQASFFYRRGGDTTFYPTPFLEQDPPLYTWKIPAPYGDVGVEYFISATNPFDMHRVPDAGTISVPFYVPEGLRHPLHAGSEAAAYRMISVPLDLDNKSARAILEDDLGPYDRTRWRFFDEHQFSELGDVSLEMAPGRAYWLVVKEPGIDLTTGAGTSLPTDTPYSIPLHAGYNLVSSPFSYPIPVTNVSTTSGRLVELLEYDGDWSLLDDHLVPFAGYAVYSDDPDVLLVDPELPTGSRSAVAANRRNDDLEWSIRILADHGEARDTYTVAAVSPGAASGWDSLDRPEPPAIGDYVRVSFPHAEWKTHAVHYSTDVRPTPEDEERWAVSVETRHSGRVDLHFEGVETVPPGFDVWLVDEAAGVRQDLRKLPLYALVSGGVEQSRHLTMIVAISGGDGPEIPSRFELFQNFPNPFNGATTIRFGVPETAAVRLEIFDILGRRVALLSEGETEGGYHTVVWDGRTDAGVPATSGLYLVRLQSAGFEHTRSVVLVR